MSWLCYSYIHSTHTSPYTIHQFVCTLTNVRTTMSAVWPTSEQLRQQFDQRQNNLSAVWTTSEQLVCSFTNVRTTCLQLDRRQNNYISSTEEKYHLSEFTTLLLFCLMLYVWKENYPISIWHKFIWVISTKAVLNLHSTVEITVWSVMDEVGRYYLVNTT